MHAKRTRIKKMDITMCDRAMEIMFDENGREVERLIAMMTASPIRINDGDDERNVCMYMCVERVGRVRKGHKEELKERLLLE